MEILYLDFYHFLKEKALILFLIVSFTCSGQEGFKLPDDLRSDKIKFELANNLIIIPVELNGVQLSFILDTGVGSTILFSIDKRESLELKNASKILLRGLGNDEPAEAIKSTGNLLKIGNSYSNDHTVYMIFDETMNFSPMMGFPVHGIIGYDFFKEFILDINYSKEFIKIFNAKSYKYRKCKKCYQTDLNLSNGRKRPLVKAKYKTDKGLIDVNLLLDSGSSSALWLFENPEINLNVPKDSFEDFLGTGFNGDIYGKKTKVESLHIGDFKINEVTASFPDSLYIQGISLKNRQGSIGGSVLRRFNVIMDYPNQKITFRKNKFFNTPFHYNMSGLTIQHSGVRVSKDYNIRKAPSKPSLGFIANDDGKILVNVLKADASTFVYSLQPEYRITEVRPNSPASIAGLLKGDKVLGVNGRRSYLYKLSDLNDLFYSEEGKRITIEVERLGVEMKFTFFLKKVI
ncbi:PDZ domain-containing protein [Aquimarina sp. BL5]|uniref:aspartyl protease family protein n=1 Tax=Aquimarina sp. BL5 TaxID=1714860 RepID=UPI000E539752|nr:aspartyl protease family protein [Aquimarina sp. BL5]AXT53128.1 PDZ domain-containing protein [Aquimarina sp. BL5]RKM94279.1 PDZ domain-containing protein [Aquimarina sp. BL5]